MPSVRVQLLGTGGPFASGDRLQSCTLIESDAGRVLIDCGTTAFVSMVRHGIAPDSIDAILLTHLHGDHSGGIPFLIVEALAAVRDRASAPRRRPLLIAGPAETETRLRQVTEAFGYAESYARARAGDLLQFITLEPGREAAVGALTATALSVPHTPEATALRIACAGKAIAVSGDTGWTEALVTLAAGADLFLCQAYTFDSEMQGLLSYRTITANAARLACQRIVLTHIGPEMQRHIAEATIEVGSDGQVIDL